MVREEPGEVQVPISQKMPLLKGSPWKVIDRGPACMVLPRISWPLRINPAGRDKGKEASRGRKGMQPGSPRKALGTSLGLGLLSRVLVPLVLEGLEALLVIAPHRFLDPASEKWG